MALLCRALTSRFFVPNFSFSTLTNKNAKYFVKRRRDYPNCFFCQSSDAPVQNAAQKEKTQAVGDAKRVSTFDEIVESRRQEARRSILVQVHSEQSCGELFTYCSQYGTVNSMHHYTMSGSNHYVLIEFGNEEDVCRVLNSTAHLDSRQVVPVRSPFLWFRVGTKKTKAETPTPSSVPLVEQNANSLPSKKELNEWMMEAQSLSDQMTILYNATKLTDVGSRLRFLTALQIEKALSGPFPRIRACPFGSSVNGFGKLNCDLDLVVELDKAFANSDSRLIFQAKPSLANERTQMQRHMETIGDICQLFLPGCTNVRRILHARVPIIKFRQEITGVECDLSMANLCAVYMSELLYVLDSVDSRVSPLVQAVRTWARDVELTNPSPGRWITNFSLTLLVLFFLQQPVNGAPAVLPSLSFLISIAAPSDTRVTDDGVNCTFIRNIPRLQKHLLKRPRNNDPLEQLLVQFFEFYSGFDFTSYAISLNTGTAIPKPEHSALYITNPLERGLNVSKNVSLEELERFNIELRNALWTLESAFRRPPKPDALWGLVAICEAPKAASKGYNFFYVPSKAAAQKKTLRIAELFREDLEELEEGGGGGEKSRKHERPSDVVKPFETETVPKAHVQRTKARRKR